MKPVKAAIYARVSTSDQDCEMQLREIREYCVRRGWEVEAEYVDTGWSGMKVSRPQLDRLMQDASRRRFDAVLVWKLDRFGRSVKNCVDGIQALASHGIRFLAISQSVDTDESNPASRLLLHILMSVAEFEREIIRERVACGLKMAKAKGKRLGRPKRVFRRDEAIQMRAAGVSWRKIAKELGVPLSTVVDACGAPKAGDRDGAKATQ
jgi:putative DNA-invertase from lambdoid prophage Rac